MPESVFGSWLFLILLIGAFLAFVLGLCRAAGQQAPSPDFSLWENELQEEEL